MVVEEIFSDIQFIKGKQFVNVMREESLGACYGSMTISAKQIECERSDN
jgi:hypothetical protein